MKLDTKEVNPAFQSIVENQDQTVFLDANFFIPPDRSNFPGIKPFAFENYKDYWLIPLLSEFSGIAIHESVYDELVEEKVKAYADEQSNSDPSKLKIYRDLELNNNEVALMNYYISKIAVHSKYDPVRDNKKDRGEVRSLSFMAVKQFLFFAANDSLPIRLIREAEKLNTDLVDLGIVQMYELIYYLYKCGKYNNSQLRILYKYQYYLSPADKRCNPDWGSFIAQMDKLYENNI